MPATAWQGPRAPVLLVEDDRHQATLLTRWLEHSGRYDVRVAGDGTLAWNLIATRPWSLIISDIGLPGVDGITLLGRFRSRDDTTPFVLISGRGTLEDAHAAIRLRASDFLLKPLDQERFVSATNSLVGSFRTSAERHSTSQASAIVGQSMRLLVRGHELVHQLASALTPLVGSVDLVVAEASVASPRRQTLERHRAVAVAAIDGTLSALADLRGLVGLGALSTEPCDLTLIAHATAMLAGPVLAAQGIALTVDTPAPVTVLGDRVRIRGLISGLVLAVAEDSSRLGVTGASIAVSPGIPGASFVVQFHRRAPSSAGQDSLDDLLRVFTGQALGLLATLDVTHTEAGTSVVHLTFPLSLTTTTGAAHTDA